MKKISTQIFILAFGFIIFAGCAKEVKTPVYKVANATAATQTNTGTSTTTQTGHTCGGGDHASNSGGNGY